MTASDHALTTILTFSLAWKGASTDGERHPQLALIDIRLVGPIDGIELACQLREQFQIPAIFLSGLTDPETKERALLAKPLGFLRKPYRASQVYNLIQRSLSSPDAESKKSTAPRKNRVVAGPHFCGS